MLNKYTYFSYYCQLLIDIGAYLLTCFNFFMIFTINIKNEKYKIHCGLDPIKKKGKDGKQSNFAISREFTKT